MSSIIIDVTTLGLDETIRNLGELPKTITDATAQIMENWYNNHFKKSVLEIIRTGDGMARNRGRYARQKGTNQPLGINTGQLYGGIISAKPTIKKTRGKEVRFAIVYKSPFYLALVHDGFTAKGFATGHPNAVVPARPFIEVARDKEIDKLFKMMGEYFESLDLTSSVLGPKIAPSLRG